MKTNMYLSDRIIRILLSIAIITLYFLGFISGILAVIALAVALIFVLTSFIGFCPLYALVGINAKKNPK
jgi:ABC-type bacteriocin/lantibiotic exporter with double-glycine peptidase domain